MSQTILYSSVIFEDLHFMKPKRICQGILKSHITINGRQPLLVQGSRMILGTELHKNQGFYYFDLVVDPKSRKFLNWVGDLDSLVIAEIFNNPSDWYPGMDSDEDQETNIIPLTQIEQEFIPSLKFSSIYKDRQSFKLKVPIDEVEFYDQEGCRIPSHLIKEGYPVVPLFHISNVYRETIGHKSLMSSRIWIGWTLLQLKVDVPISLIQSCQLTDIDDEDSEGDAIPDEEPQKDENNEDEA